MVKCWDLEQNKVIRHYHGHLSAVYSLALHPTLDLLVTGGRDAAARVWDMRTKQCVHTMTGHTATIADVKCQESDPQVVTGSMDSTIRLWDLVAGKTMVGLDVPPFDCFRLSRLPDRPNSRTITSLCGPWLSTLPNSRSQAGPQAAIILRSGLFHMEILSSTLLDTMHSSTPSLSMKMAYSTAGRTMARKRYGTGRLGCHSRPSRTRLSRDLLMRNRVSSSRLLRISVWLTKIRFRRILLNIRSLRLAPHHRVCRQDHQDL